LTIEESEETTQESELDIELNGFKLRLVGRHALIGAVLALVTYLIM